jgi:hypothetical protein
VNFLAPAFAGPTFTLPASAEEAVDAVRPVLVAGGQPVAAVILVDIEAQGVDA